MDVAKNFAPDLAAASATASPADSSNQDADLRSKILNGVQELTRSAPFPNPWDFLRPTTSTRQLNGDPHDVLASLKTQFSVDELLAARVIARSSDDKLQLSPVFGDAWSSF